MQFWVSSSVVEEVQGVPVRNRMKTESIFEYLSDVRVFHNHEWKIVSVY